MKNSYDTFLRGAITMETKYSALIGNPVDHSVSDVLYKALITINTFDYQYQHNKLNVSPEELNHTLDMLSQKKYIGLNVTLPYKQSIMNYIHAVDSTAAHIGAVNTIKINHDDLIGYNTDWVGLYKPIITHTKKKKPIICIFGTGGASRAAIYAARKISDYVHVLYRNYPTISDSTYDLFNRQNEIGITLRPYSDVKEIVDMSDIIINTTSVGMKGKVATTPFNMKLLKDLSMKEKLFIDAVFNPIETRLLQFFSSHGAKTVDGLWMMIYQGIEALSIWLERDIHIPDKNLIQVHTLLKEAML